MMAGSSKILLQRMIRSTTDFHLAARIFFLRALVNSMNRNAYVSSHVDRIAFPENKLHEKFLTFELFRTSPDQWFVT